jgi:hypothetical protein
MTTFCSLYRSLSGQWLSSGGCATERNLLLVQDVVFRFVIVPATFATQVQIVLSPWVREAKARSTPPPTYTCGQQTSLGGLRALGYAEVVLGRFDVFHAEERVHGIGAAVEYLGAEERREKASSPDSQAKSGESRPVPVPFASFRSLYSMRDT